MTRHRQHEIMSEVRIVIKPKGIRHRMIVREQLILMKNVTLTPNSLLPFTNTLMWQTRGIVT